MIKWIFCIIWGHNIDRKDQSNLLVYNIQNDPQPDKHIRYWCLRCQKYIKV